VWKKEKIEESIEDMKTAIYLKKEYSLAFHDSNIEIREE